MEGYVIVVCDEPGAAPTSYWDGFTIQEELNKASLFQSRSDAKYASANLVSIYSDKEVEVRAARATVALV